MNTVNSTKIYVNVLMKLSPLVNKIWSITPKFFSSFLLSIFKSSDFKISFAIRYLCYARLLKSCGNKVIFFPNVTIKNMHNLCIGTNVSIHENSYIDAYGGIEIHDNVAISHNVSILSFDHKIDNISVPIKNSGALCATVKIYKNVWVGAGVRVLKGVSIFDGAVIGAGSVVNKSVCSKSISVGVPCRHIRYRKG